ncbi:unnamed protein product [Leuciscus chuanchicus]
MRATGGGPPCKPLSEIGEIVEEILGTANPSICGIPDAPDPALLKLKELQRCVDNSGAGTSDASSPVSSQDISLCPPDEPSASQDTGFAQGTATEDDIESPMIHTDPLNLLEKQWVQVTAKQDTWVILKIALETSMRETVVEIMEEILEETMEETVEAMVEAMVVENELCQTMILLVNIRVGVRLTDEEKTSVKWIQENFGEEAARYTIVLFTHADQLKGKPLDEYIRENNDLQVVVNECGGRVHSFNNEDLRNRDQVIELLKKIDEMVKKNGGQIQMRYIKKPRKILNE